MREPVANSEQSHEKLEEDTEKGDKPTMAKPGAVCFAQ